MDNIQSPDEKQKIEESAHFVHIRLRSRGHFIRVWLCTCLLCRRLWARVYVLVMENVVKFPQKRYFRQRAHANPFSDHNLEYPIDPSKLSMHELYPNVEEGKKISIVDVGCGYGGFLVRLSQMFPEKYCLGMEIRTKVVEYVRQRILALRAKGECLNGQVIRSNAMKFLPNFFDKGQLEMMFFLFPDPHFKRKKHKARIITAQLLTEYAYFLAPGGMLFVATDVKELFDYMTAVIDAHSMFEKAPDCPFPGLIESITTSTEESMKVDRKGGDKFVAFYKRK